MRAHEIQIYVTNPQIENKLLQQGYAQHVTATPGQDILAVNQANVSVSKASGYVQVSMKDNVTLDTQGGATHQFTMSVTNDPTKDPTLAAYSYITTYRDYVRIYVPQGSQLQNANGFGTGQLVCWVAPPYHLGENKPGQFKALPDCPSYMYADGSLVCPPGDYGPGPNNTTSNGKVDWAVENTGYPTNYTSDIPGLAMWGGYLIVPEFCTGVLTLNWYVPNVALPSSAVPAGAPAYTLLLPRQAGTNINLSVQVQPAQVPGEASTPARYSGPLDIDLSLSVPRLPRRRT
jgi:hypothetical protein